MDDDVPAVPQQLAIGHHRDSSPVSELQLVGAVFMPIDASAVDQVVLEDSGAIFGQCTGPTTRVSGTVCSHADWPELAFCGDIYPQCAAPLR